MTTKEADKNSSMLKGAINQEHDLNIVEKLTNLNKCRCSSILGLACALMSGLLSAASGLMIKLVQEADADQILFVRVCLQYFALLPLITYRRENIISDNRLTNCFLLARGVLGLTAGLTLFYGIRYLPLGDAVSIWYVYVTLVGIFAFIFLKEPCGIFNIAVTLTTLCGLVFISQPSFLFGAAGDGVDSGNRTTGVLFVLGSAVMAALAYILVRKMGAKVHYSLSLFYYAWEGLILLPVFMACRGTLKIPCLSDLLVMIGSGICGIFAQILMTIALQNERAGPVTLVHTSQIVFAFLFQIIFLSSPVSLYSVIGASLIFLSSAVLVLQKMRNENASNNGE